MKLLPLRAVPLLSLALISLACRAQTQVEPPPEPPALPTSAASQPAPKPDAELAKVEVQGESTARRERKTLEQLFDAEALFKKHHALAPQAELKFKVYARTQAEHQQKMNLALMTKQGRVPVLLDADQNFVIDPAWRQMDPDTELRSKLLDGRVSWRADVRTPGLPANERRLGDLRLQCRVGFQSGVARSSLPLIVSKVLTPIIDPCDSRFTGGSNFADRPVFAISLVHGERRVHVSQLMLHQLAGGSDGKNFDWGFLLREQMFRLPFGDKSWPDDTRVVMEFADEPAKPADETLLNLPQKLAVAARALQAGKTTADEARELLGKKAHEFTFESGRRIARYLEEVPAQRLPDPAAEPGSGKTIKIDASSLELVLLFDPEGRLMKYALHQMLPGGRW